MKEPFGDEKVSASKRLNAFEPETTRAARTLSAKSLGDCKEFDPESFSLFCTTTR